MPSLYKVLYKILSAILFYKENIYIINYPNIPPPPESEMSLRFALWTAIPKILSISYFTIGHNINFQSFLKTFKFEISNSYKSQGINFEKKFGWKES